MGTLQGYLPIHIQYFNFHELQALNLGANVIQFSLRVIQRTFHVKGNCRQEYSLICDSLASLSWLCQNIANDFHQKYGQLLSACHSGIKLQRNGALTKVGGILFFFSVSTTGQMALINMRILPHKKRNAYQQQQSAPTAATVCTYSERHSEPQRR